MPDFDITSITVTDTSFLHLKHPVDEEPIYVGSGDDKQAVGIRFHNPGSPAYEAAEKRRLNKALVRSKRKIDLNADIANADGIQFLVDLTIGFDHLKYPPAGEAQGEDLYKALYKDPKFGWVVTQANTHLGNWANFTETSATS